jgi:hypothetical protein
MPGPEATWLSQGKGHRPWFWLQESSDRKAQCSEGVACDRPVEQDEKRVAAMTRSTSIAREAVMAVGTI